MTETADLLSRMGFTPTGKATPPPEPQRRATLSAYIADLFVRKLTDDQLKAKRAAGEYADLRAQDLRGYHAMARGK